MKKNFRWLTALAVVGTVIGIVIAYICKKNNEASLDEDDFALDSDLKPVSEREYVPLNKTDGQTQNKESESGDSDSEDSEESSKKTEETETAEEEE